MDKPNPYAELSAVMRDLAAQGVSEADVIDAAFRLAVTAAARLHGPEAVSHSLLDMAEVVRATSLLTQSIGEGFYKQLCAEEGS